MSTMVDDAETPTLEEAKPRSTPKVRGVHETALYVEDLGAPEDFYAHALGLEKIMEVPGRHWVFRSQNSILCPN